MRNINSQTILKNQSNIKSNTLHNQSGIVCVCFVLFIVCLYICVCGCLLSNNNLKTKHHNNTNCRSDINNEMYKSKIKLLLRMCFVLFLLCVYICAFRTILPECTFPSTAPLPVCVSAVVGTLAVWIPNQK